jgi:cytosine/adenosine deaminase-related metal-dependent hydrolase
MKTSFIKYFISLTTVLIFGIKINAQNKYFIIAPRLFDGELMHNDWGMIIENNKIIRVGPIQQLNVPDGAVKVNYPNATIMPGLIEGYNIRWE